MALRVAINAQLLSLASSYRNAGVGQYIFRLLEHLAPRSPDEEYLVFLPRHVSARALPAAPGLSYHRDLMPTPHPVLRIVWEQCLLPALLARYQADLLHSPVNVVPLAGPVRSVVTIHDLSFVAYPEGFPAAKRRYHRWLTRLSAKRAALILADSESTRRDLIRWFGAPPERVLVVYPGVTEAYGPRPAEVVADFRRRRGLERPYLLHVGTLQPRKNLTRLVEAFGRFKRQTGSPHLLILVGGTGWMYTSLLQRVEELGLHGDVLFPGFAQAADLPLWYAGADAVVYPSLYEGFGFPVVEAMACGTAVVASDTSSLPEVVGEAGLLVDPYDVDAITAAIVRLVASTELRQELIQRGYAQAARFRWTATADGVAQAYRLLGGAA